MMKKKLIWVKTAGAYSIICVQLTLQLHLVNLSLRAETKVQLHVAWYTLNGCSTDWTVDTVLQPGHMLT